MKRPLLLALCAVLAAAPLIWSHPFVLHIATQALIWALLAASWDVLSGYTGQTSFGHAGLFSIGAYAAAIATQRLGIPSYAAMLFAAALTACAGLAIGFPALRLRGHYLALVTLGFGEIVALTAQNWEQLTGGPFGLHDFASFGGLPADPLARRQVSYAIVLAITVSGMGGLLWLCERTDAGPAFRAIREDHVLAESLGIDTTRYKLLAFGVSAAAAGLAGSLYAFYIQLVTPSFGAASNSASIIAMAVFGGVGTIWGPFLGGILLFGLTEALRFVGVVYNLIAVGLILIACVMFAPKGIAGLRLPARARAIRADAKASL